MPASRAAPEYWIDGSKKETLADFYELESELGRYVEVQQYVQMSFGGGCGECQ